MVPRYELVYKQAEVYWDMASPVVLASHALTKDNETNSVVAQCKFENITDKTITALFISVSCFGVDGQPLQPVEQFAYLDLSAPRNGIFGDKVAIPLPDNTARKYTVYVQKVVFEGGETWVPAWEKQSFKVVPKGKPLSSLGDLKATYLRELKKQTTAEHTALYQKADSYWICGCGTINLSNQPQCRKCNASLSTLQVLSHSHNLAEKEDAYQTVQKRITEQKERDAAEQKKSTQAKQKKQRKLIAVLSGVVAVGLTVALLANFLIIPFVKYGNANNLLAASQYDAAIVLFTELNGFKDSEAKIQEAEIGIIEAKNKIKQDEYNRIVQQAENASTVEEYDTVITQLSDLEKSEDVSSLQIEMRYRRAALLAEQATTLTEIEKAFEAFDGIDDYKDSKAIMASLQEKKYPLLAEQITEYTETNRYNEALDVLKAIPLNYEGYEDIKNLLYYEIAVWEEANVSIGEALKIFNSLPTDYKDVAEHVHRINSLLQYEGSWGNPTRGGQALRSDPYYALASIVTIVDDIVLVSFGYANTDRTSGELIGNSVFYTTEDKDGIHNHEWRFSGNTLSNIWSSDFIDIYTKTADEPQERTLPDNGIAL